jgi:hypothetical protein
MAGEAQAIAPGLKRVVLRDPTTLPELGSSVPSNLRRRRSGWKPFQSMYETTPTSNATSPA